MVLGAGEAVPLQLGPPGVPHVSLQVQAVLEEEEETIPFLIRRRREQVNGDDEVTNLIM